MTLEKEKAENIQSEHKSGFTLPELLIAISIFVLVSMIAVLSFRSLDASGRLQGTRDTIINDLQDMQSWARNGRLVNFCQDASGTAEAGKGICSSDAHCTASTYTCKPGLPAGGYGIFFDQINRKYVLFADIFNIGIDLGCGNSCGSGTNEVLLDGERNLPNEILFGNVGNYRNLDQSSFTNISNFPIQTIFYNDNNITVKDANGPKTQIVERIPISYSSNTVNVYVNTVSGLIYGDSDHLEAAGSP